MRLDLTREQKQKLLAPVVKHVDERGSVPVLGCIHLRSVDGYLIAEATQRYSLAMQRVAVEGIKAGDVNHLLPGAVAKLMLRTLPMWKKLGYDPIPIRVDELDSGCGYPKIGQVIAAAAVDISEGEFTNSPISVNADQLALFADAQKFNKVDMSIRTNGPKAMSVRCGADFIGALMPIRFEGGPTIPATDDVSWATGE